ncbi:hypothetical protein CALVIDRAFT_563003 [Calocera viscosa TUFC12733]|uniref:Uncharacterized protein n=1 Tax=Calocera viscosa (strain TUFC12733) TaxID=1330018 RepID=A0A167NFX7_CALVF|nr:hypothetical protein CALVIDRAFT_563003 [Calocera viscosa TUFC12733]
MARFITDDHGILLRDKWGFPEAVLPHDLSRPVSTIPRDYEDLCEILVLSPKAARANKRQDNEILMTGNEEGSWTVATVRFQGFLKDCRVGEYGDWNGATSSCMTAINSIYVEPGSEAFADLWKCTWRVFKHVRRWVGAITHCPCVDKDGYGDMETIRCVRRVFKRTTDGHGSVLRVTGNHVLDRAALSVQRDWILEDSAVFAIRRRDGRVTRAKPAIFTDGDFVDVAVSFEVVQRPQGKFNVYLRMEHLIQLAAQDDFNASPIRYITQVQPAHTIPSARNPNTIELDDDADVDGPMLS